MKIKTVLKWISVLAFLLLPGSFILLLLYTVITQMIQKRKYKTNEVDK